MLHLSREPTTIVILAPHPISHPGLTQSQVGGSGGLPLSSLHPYPSQKTGLWDTRSREHAPDISLAQSQHPIHLSSWSLLPRGALSAEAFLSKEEGTTYACALIISLTDQLGKRSLTCPQKFGLLAQSRGQTAGE